ncbi:MAG: dialkylresorcinol condensing enzyme [Cellvibrionaceae bacterium]
MQEMKKRVLVLGYSQTGQLTRIVNSIIAPLKDASDIDVVYKSIEPVIAFPFPWPFLSFFNNFPETVYEENIELKPLAISDEKFDLIILSYQVWFLSPSRPISTFLNSEEAKHIFKDTPVITVIGCRNMWITAQEIVKEKLKNLSATLIDNIVLTDEAHSAATFIATPLWVLTGNKGPWLDGLIPRAGVSERDIVDSRRFGVAIKEELEKTSSKITEPTLKGLGAVEVNERLIASEKIARRSFEIWGKLLRSLGNQQSVIRKFVLVFYILFLITMILTVVPISAILKRLFSPLLKKRTAEQKAYFAAPSGEETHRI